MRALWRAALVVAGLALACALFGVWSAQQAPQVARYTVPLVGLATPVRIVQLSDSHVGYDMPASRLARVVTQMNALKPDIIVLTGDYISGDPDRSTAAATRAALAPFAALRAPLGVYAVLGNHDSAAWTQAGFVGTGVQFLRDNSIDAGPLLIAGADDMNGPGRPVEKLRSAIRAAPIGKPLIVIAHEPDFFQWLIAPAQLVIAGHSHGGQILLPFIGLSGGDSYVARHLRGVFNEHGQTLVVSSGLGTSILPMRINVPPEIVELTLVPAYSVGRKSGTDR